MKLILFNFKFKLKNKTIYGQLKLVKEYNVSKVEITFHKYET